MELLETIKSTYEGGLQNQKTIFDWTSDGSFKVEYFTKQTLGRGESHCWDRECGVQKPAAMNTQPWDTSCEAWVEGWREPRLLSENPDQVPSPPTQSPKSEAGKFIQESVLLLHAPFVIGHHAWENWPSSSPLSPCLFFLLPSLKLPTCRFSPSSLTAVASHNCLLLVVSPPIYSGLPVRELLSKRLPFSKKQPWISLFIHLL